MRSSPLRPPAQAMSRALHNSPYCAGGFGFATEPERVNSTTGLCAASLAQEHYIIRGQITQAEPGFSVCPARHGHTPLSWPPRADLAGGSQVGDGPAYRGGELVPLHGGTLRPRCLPLAGQRPGLFGRARAWPSSVYPRGFWGRLTVFKHLSIWDPSSGPLTMGAHGFGLRWLAAAPNRR